MIFMDEHEDSIKARVTSDYYKLDGEYFESITRIGHSQKIIYLKNAIKQNNQ